MSNRRIPAWVMSFGFHTLVIIMIALLLRTASHGAGETENRTGGIVLVNFQSQQTEYLSEGDLANDAASSDTHQQPRPLPSESEQAPELPGFASSPAEMTGVGDDLLEALPGVDALLEGNENRKLGGQVTTDVFGVRGTGSSFVYVFDRSESMEGYQRRPLLAAKAALRASLESLGEVHHFQIVFYNDQTRALEIGGQTKMFFATDENRRRADRFVTSINGSGGTDHLAALQFALSLGPDVVFLLTDAEGGFTGAELRAVGDWNRSAATINAIEFGVGARQMNSDRSLQRLARENNGQYIYKNILTLETAP